MKTINQRLQNIREKQKKSVSEMAQLIGVPASTYREWEYGRSIRGEYYFIISQVLNISLLELITGNKPDKYKLILEIEEIEKRLNIVKKDLNGIN